jgi:hypothetical protein
VPGRIRSRSARACSMLLSRAGSGHSGAGIAGFGDPVRKKSRLPNPPWKSLSCNDFQNHSAVVPARSVGAGSATRTGACGSGSRSSRGRRRSPSRTEGAGSPPSSAAPAGSRAPRRTGGGSLAGRPRAAPSSRQEPWRSPRRGSTFTSVSGLRSRSACRAEPVFDSPEGRRIGLRRAALHLPAGAWAQMAAQKGRAERETWLRLGCIGSAIGPVLQRAAVELFDSWRVRQRPKVVRSGLMPG